ncbi:MAG: hypothetical protein ACKN92_08485 [Candidatus Nanopelagicaceae bacterium]
MKSRIDIKNAVAVIVIIASFLVAIGLAVVVNNRSTYWVAVRDLTPGHVIDSTDLIEMKASFAHEANGYIQANQNAVGYSISRLVIAGEYLNESALVENDGESNLKLLSFAAAAADLPSGIRIGDAVNLYQVINDSGDGREVPAVLVIEGVYLVDLNRKSENLGGASIATVAIPNDYVERALNATRRGRMVVVINHG